MSNEFAINFRVTAYSPLAPTGLLCRIARQVKNLTNRFLSDGTSRLASREGRASSRSISNAGGIVAMPARRIISMRHNGELKHAEPSGVDCK